MKDHIGAIKKRLRQIEAEETKRVREIAEMRYAGATLVNYLFALKNDVKISDGEKAKITNAIRLFGRSR